MSKQGNADLMQPAGADHGAGETPSSGDRWGARGSLVAVGFFLFAAFLLFWEHRVHLLGYLPFLLLLACPLMHLFMHQGHGHHGGRGHSGSNAEATSPNSTKERSNA